MRTGTWMGYSYAVHPVWLLVFAVLLVSLVTSLGDRPARDLSTAATVGVGVAVIGLVAISMLIHELSHAVVARRIGDPAARIRLLVLGRPAEPEPDPARPASDLLVAATGPLVSGLVGSLSIVAAWLLGGDDQAGPGYWAAWWLGLANLALAAVHLVPVLPLDGGRIVRAVAWAMSGDLDRATTISASLGRLFGYLLIGSGLFIALTIDLIIGMWLVLLGWLTTRMAGASVGRRRMEALTAGLLVRDVTDTDPASIPPTLAVETLLQEDTGPAQGGVYPVLDGQRLLGFVYVSRLRRPLRRRSADERVHEVMVPVDRAPRLEPDDPLIRAVELLESTRSDGLPVLASSEPVKLFGVLTRDRVLDRLRARHALTEARDDSASMRSRD